MFDALLSRLKEALWPGSEAIALPTMDGALKPNRRLDEATPLGDVLPGCDDLIELQDGSLIVSAGHRLWQLSGAAYAQRTPWADECAGLLGPLGALTAAGDTVYAALTSGSVLRLEHGRITARLESLDGSALRGVTALAVLPDGRVAIAEGSATNPPADWARDLLERRAEGRIVIANADLSAASVLLRDLAWPAGLHVQDDALWFSEAWRHRVQAIPLAGGAPRPVLQNLPGYPGRFAPDAAGDVWLAVFALRTQLLEFVLREHAYRAEMLAAIDPRYWIAPALGTAGHYLEPLQGGAIKKLGIVKPWAPPRSYGLVLRLSAQGEILDSLHSRAGGVHHGITAVRRRGDALIALSKGSGRVLQAKLP